MEKISCGFFHQVFLCPLKQFLPAELAFCVIIGKVITLPHLACWVIISADDILKYFSYFS